MTAPKGAVRGANLRTSLKIKGSTIIATRQPWTRKYTMESATRISRCHHSARSQLRLTLEDNLASLATLPERVDGRSDLLTRCEPEQHGRVQAVKVGDEGSGCEDEQKDYSGQLSPSIRLRRVEEITHSDKR